MAHTPGPWEIIYTWDGTVENNRKSAAIYYRDKSTLEGINSIRICGLNTNNPLAGENESNARLIAAAPEMYELLKRISAMATQKSAPSENDLYNIITIDTLVAKIEGRE